MSVTCYVCIGKLWTDEEIFVLYFCLAQRIIIKHIALNDVAAAAATREVITKNGANSAFKCNIMMMFHCVWLYSAILPKNEKKTHRWWSLS